MERHPSNWRRLAYETNTTSAAPCRGGACDPPDQLAQPHLERVAVGVGECGDLRDRQAVLRAERVEPLAPARPPNLTPPPP